VTTVLLVGPGASFEEAARTHSSLEILRARNSEEAIEKLGRNRRIDAVLLALPSAAAETLSQIRGENPAPPPAFVPASAGAVAGATTLASDEPDALLRLLLEALCGP
jgi:hypothetical protein